MDTLPLFAHETGPMNKDGKRFLFAIFLLIGAAAWCFAVPSDDGETDKKLRKGEILVTLPETPDDRILSGRAAGIIRAPIDRVWKTISDYNNMYKFMPNLPVTFIVDEEVLNEMNTKHEWDRREFEDMLDKYRLHKLKSDTVYFYNVLAMPFPIADRWYLLKMIRTPEAHTVTWWLLIGNMKINDGSWKLETFGDKQQHTLAV